MKDLRLPLKKKWFDMTKEELKTEDYREITPYWIKRLTTNNIELSIEDINCALCALRDGYTQESVINVYGLYIKQFDTNTMTLGYPKSTDKERIITLEHKGIEIRSGNPDWGAEDGKIYFVIKHGKTI